MECVHHQGESGGPGGILEHAYQGLEGVDERGLWKGQGWPAGPVWLLQQMLSQPVGLVWE